jgi:serine/threonine-protein kinase RsbW
MAQTDHVVLTVPAKGEFARTVRLTAAELASRIGMSVDGVDDVRLAVEETFVYACERSASEDVVFDFSLGTDGIELLVGPLPNECLDEENSETDDRYARFILESVCDSFELVARDGCCFVRLVKRMA